MDDLISRQAVIDLIADYDLSMGQVVKGIHALPSVTPQEPKWIPVSERLPEENTDVLLGLRNGDKFKCFVSRRVDYNYWVGLGRDILDEIRWMPLPEPYREDGDTE